MGKKSNDDTDNEEKEKIGLTKIYILNFDRKNNDFIMESKINAFETYFYEIKSKNVYLINHRKDFVSFFNSKNLKTVKNIKFNFYENMRIINDEYFIQGRNEHDKGIFYLYKLDNFELLKQFNQMNYLIFLHLTKIYFLFVIFNSINISTT